jgi:hypothetical protein
MDGHENEIISSSILTLIKMIVIQAREVTATRLATEQRRGAGRAMAGRVQAQTKDKAMTEVVMALDQVTAYL